MTTSLRIPYRLHSERLVIRCWEPIDAPLMHAAVTESLDHLRPWMPWAKHGAGSLDDRVQRMRQWRADFDLDRDYTFAIFDSAEKTVLGSSGLHRRSARADTLEIGYWVHVNHIGRGVASETTRTLTYAALRWFGATRVEIHCDPKNVRSARVPQKLGYQHETTLIGNLEMHGKPRDTMIWAIDSTALTQQPSVRAFDVRGVELT